MTAYRHPGHGSGGSHWVNTHHVHNSEHPPLPAHHRNMPRPSGVHGYIRNPFHHNRFIQTHNNHSRYFNDDARYSESFRAGYIEPPRRSSTNMERRGMIIGRHSVLHDTTENYFDVYHGMVQPSAGMYYSGVTQDSTHSRTRTLSVASTKSSASSCPPKHPELMKTILCESWARGQNCRFGANCWFAHGDYELRDSHIPLTSYETPFSATQAQHEWIKRSQDQKPVLKADNRFMRETIKAQFRASVASSLIEEGIYSKKELLETQPVQEIKEASQTQDIGYVLRDNVVNKKIPHLEDSGNESVEAEVSSCNSETMAEILKALKIKDEKEIASHVSEASSDDSSTTVTTSCVATPVKDGKASAVFSVFQEACPMYSVAGYCAMGESCVFEHYISGLASVSHT